MKKLRVLDLFSGCGGLSLGFEKAGFDIIAGIDNWQDALVTFQRNHPHAQALLMDLAKVRIASVGKTLDSDIDVIIGGPPCQGFSISGKRDPNDPRNLLYKTFLNAVRHFSPKIFVMENVPNLVSMDQGRIKDQIVKDFESLGYKVHYRILLASDYGVPQNRKRVFFVGVPSGLSFSFPNGEFLNHKITCKEAICDLPESSLVDGASYIKSAISNYQRLMRNSSSGVFNHQTTEHSSETVRIISLVPDGGNYKDLPHHLRETRKVNIAWTRYSSSKPSFTIDTGHRHHFHYLYNRVPTVRESARLQSFPDDFVFCCSKTSQYKQVGNAVPPLLAEAVAKAIFKILTLKKEDRLVYSSEPVLL